MILSIESSCDDSSLALTRISDFSLLFCEKLSQDAAHTAFGGVVPELASRIHAKNLPQILKNFSPDFLRKNIRAVAVTTEPGLSISLLEGVLMAKTIAQFLSVPLITVNHLKGHVFSLFIGQEAIFPCEILLVSGGHTQILRARSENSMQIVAETLDDSFGESFDKVAKMLHLPYPGGPAIQDLTAKFQKNSTKSRENPIIFPIPLQGKKTLAFSFSGLKNAVRLAVQNHTLDENFIAKISHGFQFAACSHVLQRLQIFFETMSEARYFGVVGGAAANLFLRDEILKLCEKFNKIALFCDLKFCSDNAAMIGRAAVWKFHAGQFCDIKNAEISPKSSPHEFEI